MQQVLHPGIGPCKVVVVLKNNERVLQTKKECTILYEIPAIFHPVYKHGNESYTSQFTCQF